MAKETTLNEIGETLAHVVKHMATKDDLKELATKEQLVARCTRRSTQSRRSYALCCAGAESGAALGELKTRVRAEVKGAAGFTRVPCGLRSSR